jgi:hypothetical protein
MTADNPSGPPLLRRQTPPRPPTRTISCRKIGCDRLPWSLVTEVMERMLPSIPALLDQPFWLDPSDRHHMTAVIQAKSRPPHHQYGPASGDLRHDQVYTSGSGARPSIPSLSTASAPSRPVDEAIARIKQILSE